MIMRIPKRILVLSLSFLGASALACNLTGVGSDRTTPLVATLTPPPTSEFIAEESAAIQEFFVQEFDSGIPEAWSATSDWSIGEGTLSTRSAEAVLEILGEWQDMSLFTRIRFESEGISLVFNRSDSGAYAINLSPEQISLSWQPVGGDPEVLSNAQVGIDSDWHDLVLRQTHGKLEVWLDGQPALKHFNLGLSPSGSLMWVSESAGKFELDRLVIAPPGMGPGAPTPTVASAPVNLDLAIVEVSVEASGELVVWLISHGPESTQGRNLGLSISVAADDPALAIIRDPLPIFIDREWVNLFPVETGIQLDESYAGQQVTVSLQAFDFFDPETTNNHLSQALPLSAD
ncbi:MAG: hypothetical protein E4G99_10250 [Anaerolineales bacterium]|nr:MAG: hypothetical protein E4G99_10250 [Anaerolineales bacterium]